ncbi:MAG: CPBP family intramembrane metalloprotease [Anaerolineales bacterium]|jgi:membrane protease YdiL (CAAX protease family)|uniref:type II CAAX endopeptidase family protein n=1 Tax=Candidatus Villigracilis vicinus TaxID=3140679 RepID=UPI003135D849|nr:CPBP family intramembrane metalloprotease [Anaerolineales bacterium]MBK7451724.1 CPBP family intramembrane metalloprotease [Anaerolineales bacterium]MBK9781593.1 CPBP family intramembrane metalloprotease [Anaerolineales bacterium]
MKYLTGEKINFDWKVVSVTIVSTLLLMVDHYHKIFAYKYWDRILLYLVIPLLITVVFFRENPRDYGFSLGDWKLGLTYTVIGILLMAPIIYYLGHGDEVMKKYYERFLPGLPWTTFLDLFGWEFFFRGWILFAYSRKFGPEALWLHAVPFALAHIGKPEVETLSTIFGGFAFGWVAWRTRSFIYPFLIHWFIGTFIIIVAAGAI